MYSGMDGETVASRELADDGRRVRVERVLPLLGVLVIAPARRFSPRAPLPGRHESIVTPSSGYRS
jgi:hypothetical protein